MIKHFPPERRPNGGGSASIYTTKNKYQQLYVNDTLVSVDFNTARACGRELNLKAEELKGRGFNQRQIVRKYFWSS